MSEPIPPSPLRPGLRKLWMLDPAVTFLNHGSFGAVPEAVFDAQTQWRRRIEAEPVELLGRRCLELVEQAKLPVGDWLGMAPGDFGLVTNATEGVNAALRSLELRAGDELLTTTHVYHAVRQSMKLAASRAGGQVREVNVALPVADAGQVVETIVSALSGATRLLVIDHISSPTGLVFPVERIVAECRARGVATLVDGAHAPGMLDLNVPGVGADYYAGNLHKWACGPKGCGFLWVRPALQPGVHPLVVSHYLGEGMAREFSWQGTRDLSGWLTLPTALAFMAELGWERVRAHNHAMAIWANRMLCRRWNVESISPPGGEMLGSMCSIPLPAPIGELAPESAMALQRRLYDAHRIEAPLSCWNGRSFVRPSCQVYNRPEDYDRLGDAIEQLASA